jgi:outer membrane protein OmpA-like peptidoglycan-associated protein
MKRITLAAATLFAVAGCSSTQTSRKAHQDQASPPPASSAQTQTQADLIGPHGSTDRSGDPRVATSGNPARASAREPSRSPNDRQPAADARWTPIRVFWFQPEDAAISSSDAGKAAEIASYILQNPSMYVTIDSSIDPEDASPSESSIAIRRGKAVREALIEAGVPAANIEIGSFGDTPHRQSGRVPVLTRSGALALAR